MKNDQKIPEVDIVVDHEAGVIREVKQPKLHSKRGRERRANTTIYTVLTIISIIWLAPFVFLVLQSFRSYLTEDGGMVNYLIPKAFSLDNYRFLFEGGNYLQWYTNTLIIALLSALIATVIGTLASIGIQSMNRKFRTFMLGVTNIPMLNADIVTGVSMMLLFIAFRSPFLRAAFMEHYQHTDSDHPRYGLQLPAVHGAADLQCTCKD